jgi:hypothetical protein
MFPHIFLVGLAILDDLRVAKKFFDIDETFFYAY